MRPFFPFTSVKFINVWCHSFWKRKPINMYKVKKKSSSLCINIYSWQLCLHLLNSYTPPFFFLSVPTPTENDIYEFLWICVYVRVCIPRTYIYMCMCVYIHMYTHLSLYFYPFGTNTFFTTNDWIILPTFCILLLEHFLRKLMTAYLELGWAIRQA